MDLPEHKMLVDMASYSLLQLMLKRLELIDLWCSDKVQSLQSCPTLCDPIDGSLPGSPVPGILQARTLEWVANPSPVHESEREVAQSGPTLSDPMDCSLPGSYAHGIFQARVLEWGAIAYLLLVILKSNFSLSNNGPVGSQTNPLSSL